MPPSEVGYHNANEQRNIKKEKYAIQPEGAEITYLVGLYHFEEHRLLAINTIHGIKKVIINEGCL